MEQERAERLVAALRARRVMAHLADLGVYEYAVRVVLPDDEGEAVWDSSDALGLEAEVLQDGVLMGFVPHVPGSEDMSEDQLIEVIATTEYDREGLHPPKDAAGRPVAPPPSQPTASQPSASEAASGAAASASSSPEPSASDEDLTDGPVSHRAPRRHWWSRGSRGSAA
ncbi:hypothetical protein [Streptacidiphilus fuscans]|uniref:Uncharacterized protein n=1 Tax=Streptacidiphilus fuscans TaxID=2789292 RepID=A0A931B3J4_9ACTN|nr:hypothetical protein [Streptacidiphilus fuscans]MBF9069699.1 hypothetical protein [Streptacidiphilus fuscans]